jgi:hypothetical protein
MVVIIGIAVTVLFVILWRSGFLDDLMERAGAKDDNHWRDKRDSPKAIPMDPEMAKRLEVFEEFMEELPDDEDE